MSKEKEFKWAMKQLHEKAYGGKSGFGLDEIYPVIEEAYDELQKNWDNSVKAHSKEYDLNAKLMGEIKTLQKNWDDELEASNTRAYQNIELRAQLAIAVEGLTVAKRYGTYDHPAITTEHFRDAIDEALARITAKAKDTDATKKL